MSSTSEVLNRAADLIEERGWARGVRGWSGSSGYCLEGAISAIAGTSTRIGERDTLRSCPAYLAMASYLERNPDEFGNCGVWRWNDRQTDAAPVIEALRACAVIEQSREREAAEVAS